MAEPLTLDDFIAQLIYVRETWPEFRFRPVHIPHMNPRDTCHLVTHVEVDCFTDEQGPVTSVLARCEDGESLTRHAC